VVTALRSCTLLIVLASACTPADEQPPRWNPPAPSASAVAKAQERDAPPDTEPPEPGAASLEVEQIAIGGAHKCLRMSNGSVRCWGWHEWNGLPRGSHSARAQAPVRGLRGVSKIALGYGHGCALLRDETVRCWGSNASGELGDGTVVRRTTPVPVLGLKGVVDLSLGFGFGCALSKDGSVKCWGGNDMGKLGTGAPTKYSAFDKRTVPHRVVGLDAAAEIAVGSNHACARGTDGRVRCWGNIRGMDDIVPTATLIPELHDAVQISAGDFHGCARLAGNSVHCWAYNPPGDAGDAGAPREIPAFRGAVELKSGKSHSCVVMSDRSVRCMEHAARGPSREILEPTAVPGLGAVRQLAMGNGICALVESGEVTCWSYRVAKFEGLATFAW
jgi:alpha-tubulin suppressor-like RCC1 family protein